MNFLKLFFVTLVVGVAGAGCQDTKRALGFSKSVPDENTTIEGPPLTVPDNLELRPPRTGDADEKLESIEKAREAIVGKTRKSKDKSSGEKALLNKAGIDGASPNIREELAGGPADVSPEEVLDAKVEAKKLKDEKASKSHKQTTPSSKDERNNQKPDEGESTEPPEE